MPADGSALVVAGKCHLHLEASLLGGEEIVARQGREVHQAEVGGVGPGTGAGEAAPGGVAELRDCPPVTVALASGTAARVYEYVPGSDRVSVMGHSTLVTFWVVIQPLAITAGLVLQVTLGRSAWGRLLEIVVIPRGRSGRAFGADVTDQGMCHRCC